MERKTFWWLKSSKSDTHIAKSLDKDSALTSSPRFEDEISSSLADFIEKERDLEKLSNTDKEDVDIGSIIEEINRLAAQSPLGPYEKDIADRSVEDIMKEAERIYIESSKSFEQLSIHSRTSQNVSEMQTDNSEVSTPTPKSISPLPEDSDKDEKDERKNETDSYSDDFSEDKSEGQITDVGNKKLDNDNTASNIAVNSQSLNVKDKDDSKETIEDKLSTYRDDVTKKEDIIKILMEDNKKLTENIGIIKVNNCSFLINV